MKFTKTILNIRSIEDSDWEEKRGKATADIIMRHMRHLLPNESLPTASFTLVSKSPFAPELHISPTTVKEHMALALTSLRSFLRERG